MEVEWQPRQPFAVYQDEALNVDVQFIFDTDSAPEKSTYYQFQSGSELNFQDSELTSRISRERSSLSTRTPNLDTGAKLARRPSPLSASNKRHKAEPLAKINANVVATALSECCSSCPSDEEPCDDSDCGRDAELKFCLDPNCDPEQVVFCEEGIECVAPFVGGYVDMPNSHASLYRNCHEGEAQKPVGHYVRSNSSVSLNGYETQPGSSNSTSPTTPSTSIANNIPNQFSPQLELQTQQSQHNPNNPSGFQYVGHGGEFLSDSGDLFNQQWSSGPVPFLQTGNTMAMLSCPWDGCGTHVENGEWGSHFHREHVDSQMTFQCPVQAETCPPKMYTNPLAHLLTDHGFSFKHDANEYRCPSSLCPPDLTFPDLHGLHNHLDFAHATPDTGQLQCLINSCGNRFENTYQLISHVYQYHQLPTKYQGATVEYTGPPSDQLDQDRPKCPSNIVELRTRLDDKVEISLHKESVPKVGADTEEESAHCCRWTDHGQTCLQSFDAENSLQHHIRKVHLEALDNKTGYICRWDGCTRESKLGASRSGFSQRGKLERHMATHTNFKCSQCDLCGKSFSAPQAMKQHRRLHTGEKPWKCKHCSKEFAQQSACTVHERTHTNEKPLECPICLKRFSESSNLAKHRKTHGEKGTHACTVAGCGKTFHRYDQLKRHSIVHANGERESRAGTESGLEDSVSNEKLSR